jgi:hypothetical protein
MTTRIPEQRCKRCQFKIDASTYAQQGDRIPEAGNVSICVACGYLQIFNDDLTLRDPTEQEREQLERNPNVIAAQLARAYAIDPDKLKGKPK